MEGGGENIGANGTRFRTRQIRDVINNMKFGTSADKYGICAEVLAYLDVEACRSIGAAFVRRATGGDEGSWTPLSMALLPKVARPTKPKQFRAIELAHALGKLWDCILEHRLRDYITDEDNPAWAYAWQAGRQTTDLAQILRCTLQGCEAKGLGCALGGVDNWKCFNKVEHGLVRSACTRRGVPPAYLRSPDK